MRIGLITLNSGIDPATNLVSTLKFIAQAANEGAGFVLTPEVTNCLCTSRSHQRAVLQTQDEDITLAAIREAAKQHNIWILIGSLALKNTHVTDQRFINRSFLISPTGEIAAHYDKIHMFDVDFGNGETYTESAAYQAGTEAVIYNAPFAKIGLSICYDLRFPYLYRTLAQAGASILTVPAAFANTTGPAHWKPLLQARAIENGAFVLAPGQVGTHETVGNTSRQTHGHSLVISPWGEILLDCGTDIGVGIVDIDLDHVTQTRQKIASLKHDQKLSLRKEGEMRNG